MSEGKTKAVFELPELPGCVLMQSKDQITAGNAARKDRLEGKAAISNATTSCVFQLLREAGKAGRGRGWWGPSPAWGSLGPLQSVGCHLI